MYEAKQDDGEGGGTRTHDLPLIWRLTEYKPAALPLSYTLSTLDLVEGYSENVPDRQECIMFCHHVNSLTDASWCGNVSEYRTCNDQFSTIRVVKNF